MSEITDKTEVKTLEYDPKKARMFFIGGKSFRCPCGGNVFRQYDEKDPMRVMCNSCEDRYIGEA